MSRIGKMPIDIPAGVTVQVGANNEVTVKGPKGTLTKVLHSNMIIKVEGNQIIVERPNDVKENRALHGLTRSLIHNMVVGVTEGYAKTLQINGVGYRCQKQGKKLILTLGYSHPVEMEDGDDHTFEAPDANTIIVRGIDKQVVGQIAAVVREKRPPEPYKGKGIKYDYEVIRRKEGKTGAKK